MILHEPLLEKARINNILDFPYDIFVYGDDSCGSGRNEQVEPHFHFSDNIKNGNWKLSILIPTVTEWNQIKELYILLLITFANIQRFLVESFKLICLFNKNVVYLLL